MRTPLAVLLAASLFGAQTPPPPPPPQQPRDVVRPVESTGTGIIRGRVLASDTGAPIRRANVNLLPQPSLPPPGGPVTAGGRGAAPPGAASDTMQAMMQSALRPRSVRTDQQGAFAFTDLPPGRYRVSASPTQYSPQYLPASYGAKRATNDSGQPIDLGSGEVFDKATITLFKGAVITGRVTDEGGEPLARVQVYGLWFQPGSSRAQRTGGNSATDDLGQYRLYGLQAGEYLVVAEAPNMQFVPPNAPPEREEDRDGFLTTYYPGVADEAAGQRVRTAYGRETAGIEIRLAQGRLYRISGIISDSQGSPASRVNGSMMRRTNSGTSGMGFSTDDQGRFQVRNLQPGNYRLVVRPRMMPGADGRPNIEAGEFASVPLSVTADLDDLMIVTKPGVTLVGQVVFEEGVPPTLPTGMRVNATPSDFEMPMLPPPAIVGPDLKFTLKGLSGEVMLRTGAQGWYLKSVLLSGEDITDTPREFKPEDRVTIVLTSRAATLEGTVTDSKGNPSTEAAAIIMFSDDKTTWRNGSSRVRRSFVNGTGQFRITGLRPGRYYILATTPGRLNAPPQIDASYYEALIPDATTVVIGEDEQRTMDLKFVGPGGGE